MRILKITLFILLMTVTNAFAEGQAVHKTMVEDFSNSLQLFRRHGYFQDTLKDFHAARDPMLPLVDEKGNLIGGNAKAKEKGLQLEGVIYSEDGVVALIDGTVYSPGEYGKDYEVRDIRPEGVTITKKGKSEYVPVFSD